MSSEQTPTPILDALIEEKARLFISGTSPTGSGLLDLNDMEQIPTRELLLAMANEGMPCSKQDLDDLVEQCTSSDELFDLLAQRHQAQTDGVDSELAFLSLMELCQR